MVLWGKKARSGLESGLRLFDKAKAGYGSIKKFVGDIPLVGGVASNALGQLEQKAIQKIGESTGGIITPQNIQRAEGVARFTARNLPA
ncbi:MAG: hypothetical protein EB127_15690 [Alphaproteobacteria bacterium]|nr:hypothetical protein [Alphaproteobacteria bacterium]